MLRCNIESRMTHLESIGHRLGAAPRDTPPRLFCVGPAPSPESRTQSSPSAFTYGALTFSGAARLARSEHAGPSKAMDCAMNAVCVGDQVKLPNDAVVLIMARADAESRWTAVQFWHAWQLGRATATLYRSTSSMTTLP